MNKLRNIFLVAFLTISVSSVFGQNDYSMNTAQKAKEVFRDCMQYAEPEYLPTYKEWLSRVEVKTEAVSPSETYSKLKTIPLRSKCNSELSYQNANFDQATFNPLKYLISFETPEMLIYRIDETNKLLIVHPKK